MDRTWHEYRPWPWQKITFIDGTSRRFAIPILRRKSPKGTWEYREYTDHELGEWQQDQAW